MIEELFLMLDGYNREEKDENLYLEELRTKAEGVGAIKYGDELKRATGADADDAKINLIEKEKAIAKKRRERFRKSAEASALFYDELDDYTAYIVMLCSLGYTYREISIKTGMSIGWVGSTVAAAKKKLK